MPSNFCSSNTKNVSLREKCPYSEFFRFSPYSVRMRENADQKNSEYRHFLRSVYFNHFNVKCSKMVRHNLKILQHLLCRQFKERSKLLVGILKNSCFWNFTENQFALIKSCLIFFKRKTIANLFVMNFFNQKYFFQHLLQNQVYYLENC